MSNERSGDYIQRFMDSTSEVLASNDAEALRTFTVEMGKLNAALTRNIEAIERSTLATRRLLEAYSMHETPFETHGVGGWEIPGCDSERHLPDDLDSNAIPGEAP